MSVKILLIFSLLAVGFLMWQAGYDLAMWRDGQQRAYLAEQARREKEAAFITEFQGLMIYAMPEGVLVE